MADSPHISISNSNLAAIVPLLRPIRDEGKDLWIEVGLEVFDPQDLSPFMIAMSMDNRSDIQIACALARSLTGEAGAKAEQAVYVIGTDDPNISKIGVAGDPSKRFKSLQTANAKKLRISGLLWSYFSARQIEYLALKNAGKAGKRIRGEWVEMSPDEAMLLVAEAAEELRSMVADSGMWVRNRNRIRDAAIEYRQAEFDRASNTVQNIRTQQYNKVAPSFHIQHV